MLPARNFAFGGCGWMLGFHLGVMRSLRDRGALDFERGTKIAGASGGAAVAACFASGVSDQDMLEMIVEMNRVAKEAGIRAWLGNLCAVIDSALTDILPEDCHTIVDGRLTVSTRGKGVQ
eukprot:gene115-175_t